MRTGSTLIWLAVAVAIAVALPAESLAAPRCTIIGTAGADELSGTARPDVICGRGGADVIDGRGGADQLFGGPGADFLYGGRGPDLLGGGGGSDELRGGPGADILIGGPGDDRCRDGSVARASSCRFPAMAPTWPVPHRGPPVRSPDPPRPVQIDPGPPDTEGPWLQELEFSTDNVEIAEGDWWVDLSLSAGDETGIASIGVRIEGPNGLWREVGLDGGSLRNGELSERLEVPATTPTGTYRVTAVELVDRLGNRTTLGSVQLQQPGRSASFEVYDGPDREGPSLLGIVFGSPSSEVDTSSGPVTLRIPIEVADPGAGVESVRLRIAHPTSKRGNERIYTSLATLDAGTPRSGTWNATVELPAGATAGFYEVDELALIDAAEHRTYLYGPSLEDEGFSGGFTQVGAADTTRPKITSFEFKTPFLRTGAGERKLETEIGVADNWAGVDGGWDPVSSVSFWLTPPNWPISWGMGGSIPVLVSGSLQDGVWHIDRWLDEDASVGTWTVRNIVATDRAGNIVRLEDGSLEDFAAEGWGLSFENLP